MIDADKDKAVREICHIMDLQVAGSLSHYQAERYWLNALNDLPKETISEALAVQLPSYQLKTTQNRTGGSHGK